MVQETQDGYLMLDPNIVTWASVKAIQELQTELAALRAENQTLREQLLASPATAGNDTELAALRAEVAQLRQQTDRVATLEARLEQILRLLGEKAQQD
jgi:ubiquinone biosynthesis protein UbiJ